MHIITIANGAGSAGKSATAAALAHLEAEAGRRVLVIDADGQATVTHWLGAAASEDTIAAALDKFATIDALTVDTAVDGVQLVPASDVLDEALARLRGPGLDVLTTEVEYARRVRWT